jgi:hypothetical protein
MPKLPRGMWSRSPVGKAHSTPKGLKGYDRKRMKSELDEFRELRKHEENSCREVRGCLCKSS